MKKPKNMNANAKKKAISSDVHAHKASGYVPQAASYSQIHTPPALSNDYRFIREIGHGAQAKIFLSRRLKDGQQVAIKQLNIQSVKSWKAYDLFHREATVLETLNIEGVAKFYDAFECLEDTPPCSYIVQEYIEGRSLAGMLAESHRFKVTDDYDIILQMLAILQRLKQCDPPVIHRDIKPSNIMLTPKQTGGYKVTLLDFGAVANPQVQGGGSTTAGTIGYMPPEQLMGNPVLASDIYSLGVVAIQLFTGIAPGDLQIKDFRLIFEPHMEQMPQELIATLREMLEPNVAERLSDIPVLLERFNGFKNNSFAAKPKKEDLDPGNKMKKMGDQLVKVKSIGDAGNLDLWQALSDQTPRPLPECLFNIRISKNKSYHQVFKSVTSGFGIIFSVLIVLIGFLIWGCVNVGVIVLLTILIHSVFIVLTLSVLFVLVFGMFVLSLIDKIKNSDAINNIFSSQEDDQSIQNVSKDDYFDLLKYGRKTIATITEVSYCPAKHSVYRKKSLYITKDKPSFVVRYKFNPPDDISGDIDIVHKCIVHEAPEGRYKVGDPLPILYDIKSDPMYVNCEQLISIPFPFAWDDIIINELVDKEEIAKDQKIAENGDVNAQFQLGRRYEVGDGVKQDNTLAFKWYKQAAQQGMATAQTNLGVMYQGGIGVKKDCTEAFKWYKKAADQGELYAKFNLGLMYKYAIGVEQNYVKAFELIKQAAELEDADMLFELGDMYDFGYGVQQCGTDAVYYYKKAAEKGHAWSKNIFSATLSKAMDGDSICQFRIAMAYDKDDNPESQLMAENWFLRAAESGDRMAQYNLGVKYFNGKGVRQNKEKGLYWYQKAASQGFGLAQYNLGVIYCDGDGVEKDYNKAFNYYKLAAEQGYEQAQNNLGILYYTGNGVKKDYSEALKWFIKAAQQGDLVAQHKLGYVYETGDCGVDKDEAKAIYWYEQAAKQGDENSMKALARLLNR